MSKKKTGRVVGVGIVDAEEGRVLAVIDIEEGWEWVFGAACVEWDWEEGWGGHNGDGQES